VPVSPDIGTHRHAKPSKAALVFFILNIRPYDVRVNSPQGSAARPARLPWIYPHLCAAISRGRSAGSPRVPRGGVRGCAAGALAGAPRVPRILRGFPADSPRIFRGFSADFPRVPLGGPRIFRGCKCTTLPGKTMKRHPRIFRGFSADGPEQCSGQPRGPAGPPRIFRGSRGFSVDFPRVPPRVSHGFPQVPRGLCAGGNWGRGSAGLGLCAGGNWVWGELCCGLVVWARAPGSGEPQHLLAVSSSPRIL
jgi:hypothetical protein